MSAACCSSSWSTLARRCARRCAGAAGGAVAASVLALMPKCPACVAAYVAVGTGVGISVTAAAVLRNGALAVSAASLAYLVVRSLWRWVPRREGKQS